LDGNRDGGSDDQDPEMSRLFARPVLAVAAVAAIVALVAPAGRVLAHAQLLSVTPGHQEVVDTAPAEVVLRFSEPVSLSGGSVRVLDDQAMPVSDDPVLRDEVVTVGLPPILPDGTYTVVYEVISADSHRITGASVFHVGAPSSAGVALDATSGGAGWGLRLGSIVYTTVAYAGALVATGVHVLAIRAERRRAAWLARPDATTDLLGHRWNAAIVRAAVLGSLATIAGTPFRIARIGGGLDALRDNDLIRTSLRGPIGLSTAVVVLGLFALAVAIDRRAPRWVGALFALGALVGFALEGHTRAERQALMIMFDVAHLAAGAVWLGGAVGLVIAFRALVDRPRLVHLVRRFSQSAVAAVVVVSVAGAVMAWVIVPGVDELTATGWGLALITKVALVAVVVAIGAYNNRRLVPAFGAGGGAGEGEAPGVAPGRRLARLVVVEAVLLVAVLGVTSVLVTRSPVTSGGPPTGVEEPVGSAPITGEAVTVVVGLSDGGMATVSLTPGRVGRNEMKVLLHDAEHRVLNPVDTPSVELTQAELDVGPLAAELAPVAIGDYRATVDLAFAGTWDVAVRVRVGEFDSASGSGAIEVAE
jgi:copper transport protein